MVVDGVFVSVEFGDEGILEGIQPISRDGGER